jgi:hypothetical protein
LGNVPSRSFCEFKKLYNGTSPDATESSLQSILTEDRATVPLQIENIENNGTSQNSSGSTTLEP